MSTDKKKIARRLLDDAPEQWPQPLQGLRLRESIPPEIRADFSRQIREAQEEERRAFRRKLRYVLPAAAALPLALAVGYMFLSMRAFPMRSEFVSGTAALERAGIRAPLKKTDAIAEGDRLTVAADGEVALAYGAAARFQIKGPAEIEFRRLAARSPEVTMFVSKGTVFLDSDYNKEKKIVWQTSRLICLPRGTSARLTLDDAYQTLEVLSGSYLVRSAPGNEERTVAAGEALTLETNRSDFKPLIRKLIDIELEELQKTKSRLDLLRGGGVIPEKSAGPATVGPPGGKFDTVEKIKNHYGSLQKVELQDGRYWIGHITKRGEKITMHTVYGIIELDGESVKEIVEVK